MLQIIYVY